jgi:hypothetical protein
MVDVFIADPAGGHPKWQRDNTARGDGKVLNSMSTVHEDMNV